MFSQWVQPPITLSLKITLKIRYIYRYSQCIFSLKLKVRMLQSSSPHALSLSSALHVLASSLSPVCPLSAQQGEFDPDALAFCRAACTCFNSSTTIPGAESSSSSHSLNALSSPTFTVWKALLRRASFCRHSRAENDELRSLRDFLNSSIQYYLNRVVSAPNIFLPLPPFLFAEIKPQWRLLVAHPVSFFVAGINRFIDNIKMMFKFRMSTLFKVEWMITSPIYTLVSAKIKSIKKDLTMYTLISLLEYNTRLNRRNNVSKTFSFQIIMVLSTMAYSELDYRRGKHAPIYKFPAWSVGVGWVLACSSVIMIPIFIIKDLVAANGSLREVHSHLFILYHSLAIFIIFIRDLSIRLGFLKQTIELDSEGDQKDVEA